MSAVTSFKLVQLYFPKMDCYFIKNPTSDNYKQSFRLALTIIDSKNVILLFGISLKAEDDSNGKSAVGATVEVAAKIELSAELSKIQKISDLPMVSNMLAMLFPFLREKINYFFSNNHVDIFLAPINTIELVRDKGIEEISTISDLRQK